MSAPKEETIEELVIRVKKEVRSGCNWSEKKYHKLPFSSLQPKVYDDTRKIIEIDAKDVSIEEFKKKYERTRTPVMIRNGCKYWNWSASENWQIPQFVDKHGEKDFDVGHSGHLYMKFKHYLEYVVHNEHGMIDDSPMYIFDPNYVDKYPEFLNDYSVPPYFREDLMDLMIDGDEPETITRPYFRWMLMGPPRSGTAMHQDPLGTSAWNALLSGRKRWVLFSPKFDEVIAKNGQPDERFGGLAGEAFGIRSDSDNDEGKEENNATKTNENPSYAKTQTKIEKLIQEEIKANKGYIDSSGINWFQTVYPRIVSNDDYRKEMMEVVQEKDDIIYVPNKWWHVVINIPHEKSFKMDTNSCSNETKEFLARIDPNNYLSHMSMSVTQNNVPYTGNDFIDAFDEALTEYPRRAYLWYIHLTKDKHLKQLKEARNHMQTFLIENIAVPDRITMNKQEYHNKYGDVLMDPNLQSKINVMRKIPENCDLKELPRWAMVVNYLKDIFDKVDVATEEYMNEMIKKGKEDRMKKEEDIITNN